MAPASVLLRTERSPPDLPNGARYHGRVRVPLSLHVSPWARLYELPSGELRWWVRLPDALGVPCWRSLARDEPLRWAQASRLPSTVREVRGLLERASRGAAGTSRPVALAGEVA